MVHLNNGESTHTRLSRPVIFWDRSQWTIFLDGTPLRRFRREAPNQFKVLDSFEEDGWVDTIDDPLPPVNGIDSKCHLRDTIENLNRCLPAGKLRFHVTGKGERISWKLGNDQW